MIKRFACQARLGGSRRTCSNLPGWPRAPRPSHIGANYGSKISGRRAAQAGRQPLDCKAPDRSGRHMGTGGTFHTI